MTYGMFSGAVLRPTKYVKYVKLMEYPAQSPDLEAIL